MSNSRNPADCFNALSETITAIPEGKCVKLNMPHEEAMQEGWRLAALVEKYHDDLIRSDIDPQHLDTIGERAGAFSYAVATLESFVEIKESHAEVYKALRKEGYALRKKTLYAFNYIFRNDPTILKAFDTIQEGRGDLDMIKDLLSLDHVAAGYEERLRKANFSSTDRDRLGSLHKELSNLTAQLDIDPEKVSAAKLTCSKAWTYLWQAMTEIYAAGRFVFYGQTEIEELFYIDYWQNLSKTRLASEQETETATATA